MDGGYADHYGPFNGEEEEEEELYAEEPTELQFSSDRRMESFNNVDDSAGNDISNDYRSRDSSAGKLFVGGVAWETSGEVFTNYFCKYGEITDSVIMMDKITGRSRGFGFVTFADPAVANKVLEEDHVIDGRTVEVKKTVPREEMQERGVEKTRKIFVGGIPPSLTEDELKEYFSYYGSVAEHQIMFDRETGRSRGFGFVTFDEEDAVERIFSDGRNHELGGKQVEIKKAVPKRAGGDFASDGRMYRGGGSSKSYGRFSSGASDYGGGYTGKMGRGFGAYGGYGAGSAGAGAGAGAGASAGASGYGNYGAGAAGFYGGYGGYGYGFGFWGPMYGSGGYGGGGYGPPGGYGRGASYNAAAAAAGGGRGYASGGSKGYGNAGAPTGRHHPYRK